MGSNARAFHSSLHFSTSFFSFTPIYSSFLTFYWINFEVNVYLWQNSDALRCNNHAPHYRQVGALHRSIAITMRMRAVLRTRTRVDPSTSNFWRETCRHAFELLCHAIKAQIKTNAPCLEHLDRERLISLSMSRPAE